MDEQCPDAYVGWSAGKDSTVLTHLVLVECGCGSHAMSLKDDLDYPGELKYVESLAGEWGIDLDVLTPDEPLLPRLREMNLHYKDDLHSRRSEFSQVFYRLVREYRNSQGVPGTYLGIRAGESAGRAGNASRGAIYEKNNGDVVCQPLRNFEEKDIYAYLFSRGIEPHPVYKCVRLADHPTDIRKSWWIAGKANRPFDWTQWLRVHWPSLWKKHREIFPESR